MSLIGICCFDFVTRMGDLNILLVHWEFKCNKAQHYMWPVPGAIGLYNDVCIDPWTDRCTSSPQMYRQPLFSSEVNEFTLLKHPFPVISRYLTSIPE